jgi:DNA polymerase-3 subunit beta
MLDIAFKKASIKVSGGSFSFDLPSLDGADFPQYTPPDPSEHTIKVRADEFASILGRTAFAAASNDLRYYLNGVYLLISDSTINATATNSHRLSHESCSGHDGTNGSSIVPVKTVKVLQKIIEMICKDQAITISIYPTLITFEADTWMLESRVIDGKYPDISTVLSVNHKNKVIINAELLRKEIKRAEIIAASYVNLNFDTENRAIKINCSNNDEGSFISKIDIIDGDATSNPSEADYNPAYLAELLDVIEGPQCSLQYANEEYTGQLVIKDQMRPLWTGILMPVRR